MFRWIFFLLLAANVLPVLLAGNRDVDDAEAPGAGSGTGPSAGDVQTIALLNERKSAPPASRDNEQDSAIPQRRQLRCFLLGPLASMATAEAYAGVLEASGMAISRRWREVVVGADYWVYLPRLPSSRATTRTLQELKASDVDGFIFSEGELKGAIALDVYTDKVRAERRKGEFSELGYDAEIHKMNRLAREYWLVSETAPRPAVMVDLAERENGAEIPQKISRMDCKTVASAMQFQ